MFHYAAASPFVTPSEYIITLQVEWEYIDLLID